MTKTKRTWMIASMSGCLAVAAVLAIRFTTGSLSPIEIWRTYRSFWESSARSVAMGADIVRGDFDISYILVPRSEIMYGGVVKDGIPALSNPAIVPADRADQIHPTDIVVGVTIGDEARAYPIRILDRHENVNDVLGGTPIAVSYCPLCRSALVFDRRIGGSVREFGISGFVWNSNLLLYDRQTYGWEESLWSQVQMRAVTGPAARKGLRMKLLPAELTTWAKWAQNHPNTTMLSFQTGYRRKYGDVAYSSYFKDDQLMFPAAEQKQRPERFRRKEPMVVVQVGEKWKAYAVRDVAAAVGDNESIEDVVGDTKIRLTYLKESNTVRAEPADERAAELPVAYMFWFALSAMLPEADVYEPPPLSSGTASEATSMLENVQHRNIS